MRPKSLSRSSNSVACLFSQFFSKSPLPFSFGCALKEYSCGSFPRFPLSRFFFPMPAPSHQPRYLSASSILPPPLYAPLFPYSVSYRGKSAFPSLAALPVPFRLCSPLLLPLQIGKTFCCFSFYAFIVSHTGHLALAHPLQNVNGTCFLKSLYLPWFLREIWLQLFCELVIFFEPSNLVCATSLHRSSSTPPLPSLSAPPPFFSSAAAAGYLFSYSSCPLSSRPHPSTFASDK